MSTEEHEAEYWEKLYLNLKDLYDRLTRDYDDLYDAHVDVCKSLAHCRNNLNIANREANILVEAIFNETSHRDCWVADLKQYKKRIEHALATNKEETVIARWLIILLMRINEYLERGGKRFG